MSLIKSPICNIVVYGNDAFQSTLLEQTFGYMDMYKYNGCVMQFSINHIDYYYVIIPVGNF